MTELEKIKKENKEFIETYLNKKSSAYHHLKLKDLRMFVELTKDMEEDSPVVVERVEDSYFEPKKEGRTGWSTYKGIDNEGFSHHLQFKKELLQENWKKEYPKLTEKDRETILSVEEEAFYSEQFYSPWCITADKKESIVKIHSHY